MVWSALTNISEKMCVRPAIRSTGHPDQVISTTAWQQVEDYQICVCKMISSHNISTNIQRVFPCSHGVWEGRGGGWQVTNERPGVLSDYTPISQLKERMSNCFQCSLDPH